jgi:hypothetical protein
MNLRIRISGAKGRDKRPDFDQMLKGPVHASRYPAKARGIPDALHANHLMPL